MLVKRTPKHLISVSFDYRRRIMKSKEDMRSKLRDENPEILKKLEPQAFSSWLKNNGMMPPDFDLPEYDEETIRREYEQANSDPLKKYVDDEDDRTRFDISIINKQNEGLLVAGEVFQGELHLLKVFSLSGDALAIARTTHCQRLNTEVEGIRFQEHAMSHAPNWEFLSENLQAALVEYLFSVGIHPSLGICLEYLSWNKEQRLYMGWLKDINSLLFKT